MPDTTTPSLFETQRESNLHAQVPLPERMRPQKIEDMVGQSHLLSAESAFQKWLKNSGTGNILLYGPPGCGKTTLAYLIAKHLNKKLISLNAVLSNLNDLRNKIHQTEQSYGQAILFIDEIHRFNRSQQDVLLPFCETGKIQLIGATTHNPAFYLIPPLLSRSYVFELNSLSLSDIQNALTRALHDSDHGLRNLNVYVPQNIIDEISRAAGGDLRRGLNILEFLCLSVPTGGSLDEQQVQQELIHWNESYNARENDHYDFISAFIKSIRGSDPDAAIYWLARMLNGGEDPLFIARRLIILASEDVGLADSRGLNLATSTYFACEKIGMPECAINLSHTTIFLALAAKSNSAYEAWNAAHTYVSSNKNWQKVPNALQQTPLHREDTYKYSHNYEANVSGQSYWNESQQFYFLKPVGAEKNMESLYLYRKQLKEKLNGKRNE